jgi:alcohol dehydrogenase (NADP+)
VRPALEKTLADLGLEYLDLYLMHWPVAMRPGVMRPESASDFIAPDELTIEATWDAMTVLPGAGLARQIGVSNFSAAKIRRVRDATGVLPAVDQVEMHPYLQQSDLLAATREMGVALTAYSPMGTPDSGEMFGRDDPFRLLDDPVIADVAVAHTATPGQILIAWALQRGTSVIPKSTNEGRIRENLAACDIALTDDEMTALAALDRHHRYIDGSFWCPEGSPWTLATLWDE